MFLRSIKYFVTCRIYATTWERFFFSADSKAALTWSMNSLNAQILDPYDGRVYMEQILLPFLLKFGFHMHTALRN